MSSGEFVFFFFVLFYLTLKNEEVQNAIPIFFQRWGT